MSSQGLESGVATVKPSDNSSNESGESDFSKPDEETFPTDVCVEAINYLLSRIPNALLEDPSEFDQLVKESIYQREAYTEKCDPKCSYSSLEPPEGLCYEEIRWYNRESRLETLSVPWDRMYGPR